MTNEPNNLLPCPWCDKSPQLLPHGEEGYMKTKGNPMCLCFGIVTTAKRWNTRPTLTASLPPDIGKFVKDVKARCSNPPRVETRQDGDSIMACFEDFVNLQESTAAFADTPEQAVEALLNEDYTEIVERILSILTTLSSENERLKKIIARLQEALEQIADAEQATTSFAGVTAKHALTEAALRALEAKEGGKAETK